MKYFENETKYNSIPIKSQKFGNLLRPTEKTRLSYENGGISCRGGIVGIPSKTENLLSKIIRILSIFNK